MGAKKIKTEIRKAQVMAAALELISSKGIEGLTISALARKVGMTNSNMYRHFRNKNDVMASLMLEIGATLKGIIKNAKDNTNDSLACLKQIFMGHIAFFGKNRNIPRVIFLGDTYADKIAVKKLSEHASKYAVQIMTILEEGVKSGLFARGLDTKSAVLAFIGHIQSITLQWILSGYAFSIEERARKIWPIYLKGIASR